MHISRREILKHTAAIGAAALLTPAFRTTAAAGDDPAAASAGSQNGPLPVPEPRVARFERLAFGMFIHCLAGG